MWDAYKAYTARHGAPPRPGNCAEIEERALAFVAKEAFPEDGGKRIQEIEIEDVRLIGEFPRSQVAVTFRWSGYPDLLMGRRCNIWKPDGSYDRWTINDMLVFLGLDLGTRRQTSIPSRTPVASPGSSVTSRRGNSAFHTERLSRLLVQIERWALSSDG